MEAPLFWGVPVGAGLLIAKAVMSAEGAVRPELYWAVVSLSVGVSLVAAAAYVWIQRRMKLKYQLVAGLLFIFYGLSQLGWV
ncbi:hypothetical protein ES706_00204 [subsurface metagenome]|nr:hypothetical protein [Hadesarchaea archaeon]